MQKKIENNVSWLTILLNDMISNHSKLFILVSCKFIIQIIYITWILYLISKWGIITVFTFGFWKSYIFMCQNKKSLLW